MLIIACWLCMKTEDDINNKISSKRKADDDKQKLSFHKRWTRITTNDMIQNNSTWKPVKIYRDASLLLTSIQYIINMHETSICAATNERLPSYVYDTRRSRVGVAFQSPQPFEAADYSLQEAKIRYGRAQGAWIITGGAAV